jgi:hypothetical protein
MAERFEKILSKVVRETTKIAFKRMFDAPCTPRRNAAKTLKKSLCGGMLHNIVCRLRNFLQNQIFLVILIFIFAFGIRLYYVFQKEGLIYDEVGSIVIATWNNYCWRVNYDENKIYTGKEIKEITFFTSSSIKQALADVHNLRLYNHNRDRPHTNLHYSCLRLWFAGTQTSDVQRIIIQGCLLNLLFFSLSFLFLYKLAKLLFTNKWIILLALVVAFLNTGAISTTMYIRMYQLQETLFIILTWLFSLRPSYERGGIFAIRHLRAYWGALQA